MEGSSSCRRRGRGRPLWQGIKQILDKKRPDFSKTTLKKQPDVQPDFSELKCRSVPQDAVIYFVEELEKAEQYFELKRFLANLDGITSNWYIPNALRVAIINDLKYDLEFNMLDEEDINHALNCLDNVLHYQRRSYFEYVENEDRSGWGIKEVTTICESVLSKDVDKPTGDGVYPLFGLVEELDEFVTSNPILILVSQARNKGYCLNPDPEVELLGLKESYPFYYYNTIIGSRPTYKAKTVAFTYEALDASVEDIKSLLSAHWKIFYVCINRLDTHFEMAHVTFKELTEANEALVLAAQGQVKIPGQTQPVGVVRTRYNKPPSSCKFPHVKPEHVKAAKTGVQKVENALFADALNKYRKLIEKNNWGRSASTLPGQSESGQKGTELPDGVSVSDVSPGHSLQSVT